MVKVPQGVFLDITIKNKKMHFEILSEILSEIIQNLVKNRPIILRPKFLHPNFFVINVSYIRAWIPVQTCLLVAIQYVQMTGWNLCVYVYISGVKHSGKTSKTK